MNKVERHTNYPQFYADTFDDVFKEADSYEWGYGKTDRYRILHEHVDATTTITLQSIKFDGEYNPIYTSVYRVEENGSEAVHFAPELEVGQVPEDARNVPELVLRGILHNIQELVVLRNRNGLR